MQLGQIAPAQRSSRALTPQTMAPAQKAAIVVHFLMTEGSDLPLADLPEDLQSELAQQMGALTRIDRDTLMAVVTEFADELESTGLTFPKGLAGVLSELDGKISPHAAAQLRKRTGLRETSDPWVRLNTLSPEQLIELINVESTEVASVLISKINVKTAAKVLGLLPGKEARRITYAVSQTTDITTDAVNRIGRALLEHVDSAPDKAFAKPPEERLGAILNSSRAETRDALLDSLEEEDQDFGTQVRKAVFTFKHIALRIDKRDIGAIVRDTVTESLVRALAAAKTEELKTSADFILDNISSRLSTQMRAMVEDLGTVKEDDGEAAMAEVVEVVANLVESGEILLKDEEEVEKQS